MRRPVVLALAAGLVTTLFVTLTGTAASAHICPVAAQIPVGISSTVNVGVTVEEATVPDVVIEVPAGLRLDRAYPKDGWTVARRDHVLRYRGGPIAPFKCEYFPIGVTATARGAFGIPVVQRDASGRVVARSTPDPSNPASRLLDQLVYAGVKPPSPPSNGPSVVAIGGIALIGAGVIAGGVLAWRSRRGGHPDDAEDDADDDEDVTPDERDAELRARLERFRTRAPDRTSGS